MQVKYKRKDEPVSAAWMISTLEKEKPKIDRLVSRGATSYLMVTNASMTGALDKGTRDKVQTWMDDNLSVPGFCLWRDDLDRRLDRAEPHFKLKHSEILAGDDAVSLVLAQLMGPTRARQQRAIRAFVRQQFDKDKVVKFKQVNMENGLFDLFVDVHVNLATPEATRRARQGRHLVGLAAHYGWAAGAGESSFDDNEISSRFNGLELGAAEFLLGASAQESMKRIVLQGAPGQGKSTLAQYVCQVHRSKFLGLEDELALVPERLSSSPFRIPVKVDLRDFAAYLNGEPPFAVDAAGDLSLEVFLAGLIRKGAGGLPFSVEDLIEVVASAPVLLFLDGLDEVADVNERQALVNSVVESLTRFDEYRADVQTVVTSRPSIFGRAPSFFSARFTTFRLDDVSSAQVDLYADKWVVARGLDEAEKAEVRQVLVEKLKLPHIRDLTKNPMQLAILLSLIHSEGPSLPDQRTELYRRYIDLFLNRESEKDGVVKTHRVLLVAFLQHLAWLLQSRAESSKSTGAITLSNLNAEFDDFLRATGNREGIATELFNRGLERIFVLVERIEGTFEFEVQPLREYFCARHLFETSPYGAHLPAGARGDRAHRFEAMAVNPFWTNVVRFYAGCWNSGEIPALVLSLREIIETGTVAQAIQARRVGIVLLNDWVFSSKKFAQKELIDLLFDDVGLALVSDGQFDDGRSLELDVACGQSELRSKLFTELATIPVRDVRAGRLCILLSKNGGDELKDEFQELLHQSVGTERTLVLGRMIRAGAASTFTADEIWHQLTLDGPDHAQILERCSAWLATDPFVAGSYPALAKFLVTSAIDGRCTIPLTGESNLEQFLSVFRTAGSPFSSYPSAFHTVWRPDIQPSPTLELGAVVSQPLASVFDEIDRFIVESLSQVNSALDLVVGKPDMVRVWSALIESIRANFGDVWPSFVHAARAAGMATMARGATGSELLNDDIALYDRARAARLRRGDHIWWGKQLDGAASDIQKLFVMLMILKWAPMAVVKDLAPALSAAIDLMSTMDYELLVRTMREMRNHDSFRSDRKAPIELSKFGHSGRLAVLIALATPNGFPSTGLSAQQRAHTAVVEEVEREKSLKKLNALPSWTEDPRAADQWLRFVLTERRSGREFSMRAFLHMRRAQPSPDITDTILRSIAAYPPEIVDSMFSSVEASYRPGVVGKVASSEAWTFV
jgi:hypothetical protein